MSALTVAAPTGHDAQIIAAGILAGTSPLEELRNSIVFGSMDWGNHPTDAWIYGIVVGWDNHDEDDPDDLPGAVMASLADKFGWDDAKVARLRALHAEYVRLGEETKQ